MPTIKKDKRPTFTYNGQPVRAAGLLIYTTLNLQKEYLFRWTKKGAGDIGGKTDEGDRDIIDTIVRETTEETNGKLFSPHVSSNSSFILDNILRNEELEIFYCPKGKYILVKVELDTAVRKLNMKRFGLKENGAVMNHYYSWTSHVNRQKLHPRLKFHTEYNKIF